MLRVFFYFVKLSKAVAVLDRMSSSVIANRAELVCNTVGAVESTINGVGFGLEMLKSLLEYFLVFENR